MNRVTITLKPTIALELTADDWGLYDIDDWGKHDIDNRAAAAVSINRAIESAINDTATAREATKRINTALQAFANFGAADTEGWSVAYRLLDLAYPNAG